jgi:LacI family transcriptional regulator
VARHALVSPATVSRLLNGTSPVSDALRRRIEQAMAELAYRPSPVARSLAGRPSGLIGVVVTDVQNPFYAAIMDGVESVAQQWDYTVILCNSAGDPRREQHALEQLHAHRVDGVVLAALDADDFALWFTHAKFRVVCVNSSVRGGAYASIRCDDFGGGLLATQHLIGLGHRRIAHIAGAEPTSQPSRSDGYLAALGEIGLSPDESLMERVEPHIGGGELATHRLLERDQAGPSAIFAHNDLVALGALKACRARGLRVPEDVSVMGYDDIWAAELADPPLTTVRQPAREMGAWAATQLLHILGTRATDGPVADRTLDCQLVVRASTAALKR